MNLVNFLHNFCFAGVSSFSPDVGPAAQQSTGELGPGAVVPGQQGRHAVSRRDQSLVVDATYVAAKKQLFRQSVLTSANLPLILKLTRLDFASMWHVFLFSYIGGERSLRSEPLPRTPDKGNRCTL